MVENGKNTTKVKIKHRNGAIARPSVRTFSPSKGWRKHFLPEFYPVLGQPGSGKSTIFLLYVFYHVPVIGKEVLQN